MPRSSVSIPIGFSNELQHILSMHTYVCTCTVSIPIGFSNELQRSRDARRSLPSWFQSLSGFPMSCNPITGTVKGFFGWVSIPIGFSNELQRGDERAWLRASREFQSLSGFPMSCNPPAGGHCYLPCGVSIPTGFPNELQPYPDPRIWDAQIKCFNPYRIFQ